VYSGVGGDEFMIRGSKNPLKEADINPLTSDKIIKNKHGLLGSYSTVKEIEGWKITFLK
jgi:hypothetical protein